MKLVKLITAVPAINKSSQGSKPIDGRCHGLIINNTRAVAT